MADSAPSPSPGVDSPVARSPLFRGLPIAVWALCAFFVASMLMWTITKVAYSQPDERAHVSAVLYWSEFHEWPEARDMMVMLSAMRSAEFVGGERGVDAPPRPDRPSFAELTGGNLLSSSTINQMSQHPPLYYMGLSVVHDLLPDSIPADTEVWIFRFISVLLTAPLPLLSAALARRLGASRPMVILAAAVTAGFPGLAVLGAAVNNDNLLNIASAWAILGMGMVLTGDLRKRTALWIGFVLAVALLTKAFAIPIALGVGIAYLVSILRSRRFSEGFVALGITVGVAALGGWWWVWNLIRYGTLQPAGVKVAPDGPLSVIETLRIWGYRYLDVFFTRFWAMMDPPNFRSPIFWLSIAATAVGLVALVAGLIAMRRSKRRLVDTLVLLVPFALAFAILAWSTFGIAMREGYPAGVQGRYLYGGLVGLIVACALAIGQIVPRTRHAVVAAIVGLIAIGLGIWRLWYAIRWGWVPGAPIATHFEAIFAWAPIPFALSITIVALYVAATVAAIVLLVREVAQRDRRDADTLGGSRDAMAVDRA